METVLTKEMVKALPIVKHVFPPNFVNLRSGRHAMFPKGQWYLVADDVTLEDIQSRWEPWVSTEVKIIPKNKEWKVTGSKGKEYTVSLIAGVYSCTCPGYGFRRKCKHSTAIKDKA